MKLKISILLAVICFSIKSKAQVTLQGYAGNDGYEFSSFIQKTISKNEKLSYYGYSNYFAEYKNNGTSTAEVFQTLNYQLIKNAGVSLGGTFTQGEFIPQVGLCYGVDKKHYSVSIFPGLGYSFKDKQINYGLNGLIEYSPKINDLWNFYSMLVLGSDFDGSEHTKTNEHLRLGLEYKTKFQFGLGLNLEQNGSDFNGEQPSFGIFAGYTLF